MQNTIIRPSTRLLVVNVHKLQDTGCNRYYFWRWILNLVPKRLNLNFWFGSVMHRGWELMSWGKSLPQIYKGMVATSQECLLKDPPREGDKSELDIQLKMGKIMLAVYYELHKKRTAGLVLQGTELRYKKRLRTSPVDFVGTLDAYYKEKKALVLDEGKTASRLSDDSFRRLKFDKQINGYAIGLEAMLGQCPVRCRYTVFRKPQIRPRKAKKPETIPQFLTRLEEDLHERADWYFVTYIHRFGRRSVAAVLEDIEWLTFDLYAKYNYLSKDQLLNPHNWPRNDNNCFTYGTCPYFGLCNHYDSYPLHFRFFRGRDIRYEGEGAELDASRQFSTAQKRKGLSK